METRLVFKLLIIGSFSTIISSADQNDFIKKASTVANLKEYDLLSHSDFEHLKTAPLAENDIVKIQQPTHLEVLNTSESGLKPIKPIKASTFSIRGEGTKITPTPQNQPHHTHEATIQAQGRIELVKVHHHVSTDGMFLQSTQVHPKRS